jgi:predicted esterase
VFCPAGIEVCREAYVRRGSGTGGPLNMYWHGTYENAVDVQSYGAGGAVLEMTLEEDGLAFYPEADPEAVNRPNNPYPWWIVGSYMSDRKDDFHFMDEMIACAAEEGLVDLDRINVGGMSAGGIMSSHLVSRRGYWASAVSWSGGWTVPFEISQPTPTMVLHGGPSDCFGSYCFMNPSEFFAEQLVELGVFAFLCDHSEGDTSVNHHTDAMGAQGAEFMSLSVRGQPHPWEDYPFGSGGHYMLDTYCYTPGTESPWAPWE